MSSAPPLAMVPRLVARKHRLKKARGFSLGELTQAGLDRSHARSVRVRIDKRRSTAHAQNVAALKAFLLSSTPKANTLQPPVEPAIEGSEIEKHSAPVKKKRPKPSRTGRAKKPKP